VGRSSNSSVVITAGVITTDIDDPLIADTGEQQIDSVYQGAALVGNAEMNATCPKQSQVVLCCICALRDKE
jgi:hypothetical protein